MRDHPDYVSLTTDMMVTILMAALSFHLVSFFGVMQGHGTLQYLSALVATALIAAYAFGRSGVDWQQLAISYTVFIGLGFALFDDVRNVVNVMLGTTLFSSILDISSMVLAVTLFAMQIYLYRKARTMIFSAFHVGILLVATIFITSALIVMGLQTTGLVAGVFLFLQYPRFFKKRGASVSSIDRDRDAA